jgi:hypothetical protein
MLRSLGKITIAASLMGAACWAVVHVSHSRALNVLAGVPVGVGVFYAIASALRIPEVAEVQATVARKLGLLKYDQTC